MDKSLIHGHEYHHGEDMGDLAEKLGSEGKYKERLSAARDQAFNDRKRGVGKFEAEGHHYRVKYDRGNDRYEIERDHF